MYIFGLIDMMALWIRLNAGLADPTVIQTNTPKKKSK